MIYLILLLLEIFVLYILMRRVTARIFRHVRPYIFAILFLPGTFIHETSHFLTALILLVPVGQIELMPVVGKNEIKMGSVPIGKTDPIRRTLIGIAPIIFGIGIIYAVMTLKLPWFVDGFIAFEVGNSMFSSKKDLEGSLIVGIIVALIILILYLIGVRINFNLNLEVFKKADTFLLVPITVDFLFLIINYIIGL